MNIRKAILATAVAAATLTAVVPSVSFARDDRRWSHDRHYRGDHGRRDHHYADRRGYRDDRGYRCRKSGGTTGLLVGGVAGALLGRAVDTQGDRAPGTIIGAGAGALAGRAIDRNSKC
ncbi:glycine zipper 2TM domain-containing protein [Sphingobium sp.]|uniref:glycine zipper 2TM domain-containing protein n=1 Tax=Sphingobium sp. TaxID=1912891 RepID=UPI002BBBBA28|nr:glycine zipper domain-containing protein [Sphingobium sp.]HUD93211.1 glycine zipper domain-containing protein [Sphingobium sp.]